MNNLEWLTSLIDKEPTREEFIYVYHIDEFYYTADGFRLYAIPDDELLDDSILGQPNKLMTAIPSIVSTNFTEIPTQDIGDYLDVNSMELLTNIGGCWLNTRLIEDAIDKHSELTFAIGKLKHAHLARVRFADRTAYIMEMYIGNPSHIVPMTPELETLAREYLKFRDRYDENSNYIDKIEEIRDADEFGNIPLMYRENFRIAQNWCKKASQKMAEIKRQVTTLVTKQSV
jgi:hypothetical protein